MATKPKKAKSSTSDYEKFIKTLRLSGLGMEEASAHVDRNLLGKLQTESVTLTVELNLHDEVVGIEEGFFVVVVRCEAKQVGRSDDAVPVKINCAYSALYTCEGIPDEAMVKRFAGSEARVVFWPYLRQFVADTTSRMSVSTILLPLTSELSIHNV